MKQTYLIICSLFFFAIYSCSNPEKEKKESDKVDKNYTDCSAFIAEYEAWADKFIDVSKLCQAKPDNVEMKMKKEEMSKELPQWGLKKRSMVNCADDIEFNKKCDEITNRIAEVMDSYTF